MTNPGKPTSAVSAVLPLSLPVIISLAVLMLFPVGSLLALSAFGQDGALSSEHYSRLFSTGLYIRVMLNTLQLAGWTTVICILIGYPVAYAMATARSDKIRNWLMFFVLISFWSSVLVRTFSWIVLLGRKGAVNSWAASLGLTGEPMRLLYTQFSVLLGMSQALTPMAILIMYSVMSRLDTRLVAASSTLGAPAGSGFWRIYFPLSLPGVISATLLVFIDSLGYFVTPVLLGGREQTVITQLIIQQVQELLNWPFAGAVSVLLLLTALVIYWVYDKVTGMSSLDNARGADVKKRASGSLGMLVYGLLGRVTDAVISACQRVLPHRVRRASSGSHIWLIAACAVLFYLCVPMLVMLPLSVNERPTIDWPPSGFSTKWYVGLFESPLWFSAIVRSLTTGLLAAVLTMLIALPAAVALGRYEFRGKRLLTVLVLMPMIMPRIVIAVALFYLYARIQLVGTTLGLVLGHTVVALPLVVITLVAVVKGYDVRYELAAATLGARRIVIWRKISFPLLRTGILSGLLIGFITSFDDLTIALFVTGGLQTTLPKQMWDDAIMQLTPTLAAASTLLLLTMLLTMLSMEWLRSRSTRMVKGG